MRVVAPRLLQRLLARLHSRPLVLAAIAATATAAAAAAAAPTAATAAGCPARPFGRCFTVTVPLDRAGAVPGTIRLRAARVRSRRARRPPLFALTGGPGQAGVLFAATFEFILPTAGRDLVVFDQRGTGASGLLRCRGLERRFVSSPSIPAGSCGRSLGARRSFYRSADSADDIEAIRARLGARQIALYAVSYGTQVAVEYARRYPQRVDRMILDSPVGPDAPDSLARETIGAVRRVIRTACRTGCGRARAHPVADLARLRAQLRRAPIRRLVQRARRRVPVRVDADDLLTLVVAADLNPAMLRQIPVAVRAALRGRDGPLVRLKLAATKLESGGSIGQFSPALFAATTCEESPLAWDPLADPEARRRQARAAAEATPASVLAPFDRTAALRGGLLSLCADWPAPERAIAPAPPLPTGVATLVLSGELDLRTPLENARRLADALGARLLVERDVGHGVVGADPSGCADPAVAAFLARRALPACRRSRVRLTVVARAARARSPLPAGPAAPRGLPRR